MGDANELLIKISGDAKELNEAFDQASKKTADLNESLKKVAEISAVAFAAFTAEAYLSIDAYKQQEEASNSLIQSMQQQGIYSKELYDSYAEQADSLEKLTGIDQEAIMKGQAYLQGMLGQTKISKDLTKAVVDLSVAKKVDLFQAFELVGKAATENTQVLKKSGIEVTEHYNREKNLAEITTKLTEAVGGQAEAAVKGVGSIALLKVAYDDVQKAIGARLAPAFTMLTSAVTGFFNSIGENENLLNMIVAVGTAGAVVAALGTVVGVAGTAFLTLRAALLAANISMEATSIAVKGLVGATGLGLIVIVATEVYLNWNSIWPRMYGVFRGFVEGVSALLSGLGTLLTGAFTFDTAKMKEGLDKILNSLKTGYTAYEAVVDKAHADIEAKEDQHQKTLENKNNQEAAKREALKRRHEQLMGQIEDEQRKIILDKLIQYNADYVKLEEEEVQILTQLADEKNQKIWKSLDQQLAIIRQKKDEAARNETEQQAALNEQLLKSNDDYQKLSTAEKTEFLRKNEQQLRQSMLTEKTARQANALDTANQEIKSQNQMLKEQAKFGAAYALINKSMHSEIYQGTKSATTDLEQLQNSSNSNLKAIGKAASFANIVMKTAESAMNIYAGFSTIPIIGPGLGIAGAAAAIAYGAEQEENVLAAADGGILTGGIPGRDSIPVLGMPGELVVPTRNFDEVVNAVANSRAPFQGSQSQPGQGLFASLEISLKDDLMNFIEMKLNQRSNLHISLKGT